MIWTLIGIGLSILGLVCGFIEKKSKYQHDVLEGIGILSSFIGFILSAICLTIIVITQCTYIGIKEKEEIVGEYNALIRTLEESKDTTIRNDLYKDIEHYNVKVRAKQHSAESLWTNWFYKGDWSDLKEIEY